MKKRRSTFRKIHILTALSVLLFALAVSAQDMDLTDLSLEDLANIQIDMVYTASKHSQKVTEAPSSVSIITADDIKKYGYRDLGEILQSVRGFYVTDDRNYKYLGVRGFGLPSDYSNRVLVLVDGMRTNDNIYDAPSIGTLFRINLDLVDRIEIVRGPGSSLYGTSAFFAVINVVTKTGRDFKGIEISGDVGTFKTSTTRISYGNKYQNGLELLLSTSYHESKGNDSLDYTETYDENPWICADDDPANCYGLQDAWWYVSEFRPEDLDYKRSKKYFAELKYQDFTFQGTYSDMKKGLPTAPWESIFNDNSVFSYDKTWSLDLKYEHVYDNQLAVFSRINYHYYKYYGEYRYDDTGGVDLETVLSDDGALGKWLYGELHITKNLGDNHKVTVGGDYQHNIKQYQDTIWNPHAVNFSTIDFRDEQKNDNWALFIQDEYTITDNVIVNGGVRYDFYETFGETTNPRIALIYNPFPKTSLKAVYGRAFRAPNVYELSYDDGNISQKGNSDLRPETIDSYEIIYEQFFGNTIRSTIVGFQYNVKDLIKQTTDASDGLLVFENSDEIQTSGVEFELEGKWESGLESRFSYTYQEAKEKTTDDLITNSPEHLVKANLTIPVIKDKLIFSIEEQYTSERRTLYKDKQTSLPASLRNSDYPSDKFAGDYAITNVTLLVRNFIDNLELSASAYNLFDTKYGHPGAGEHFQDTIEQNGTTLRLKATYLY